MSSVPWLQWALTAVFAVCAGLYVAQVRAADGWQSRVAWSLHVLMALAMIAMAWPWGMSLSPIVYVVTFTGCALYFAYLGLFTARIGHTVYHAVMMVSMVLMALAMPTMAMTQTADVDAMGAMGGMSMASGGGMKAAPMSIPAWVVMACGTAAVFFTAAALHSFFVLIRGPQRPYANLLMTAGMGVSFAALAM